MFLNNIMILIILFLIILFFIFIKLNKIKLYEINRNLFSNNIVGTIPESIGKLTKLTSL